MSIRRYVEKRVVFTSQALSAMGKALEQTTEILGIGGNQQNVKPSRNSSSDCHRTATFMRPRCATGP